MKQFVLSPEQEHSEEVRLTGSEFHYLCVVRRYRAGDEIPARTSGGRPKTLTLTEVGADFCLAKVDAREEAASPGIADRPADTTGRRHRREPRVVLCQATLKGKKLDQVVRQATEAGVERIIPVVTDHSVSDPVSAGRGEKKVERWRTIAKEAVQQSGRRELPAVQEPMELDSLIPQLQEQERRRCIFFHEAAREAAPLHRTLLVDGRPANEIWILVGPEGGLSADEVAKLRRAGCVPGFLGPQVLRSETAAIFAVAAVKTVVGEVEEWALRVKGDAQ